MPLVPPVISAVVLICWIPSSSHGLSFGSPYFLHRDGPAAVYSRCMNEAFFFFTEMSAWLTQAGLAGTLETDIVYLDSASVASPLDCRLAAPTCLFIDTLHPVYEGRVYSAGAMVRPSSPGSLFSNMVARA